MELFTRRENELRLTLVCGVGEFGAQIIAGLSEQLQILHPNLQLATRCCVMSAANNLEAEITAARSDLTSVSNQDNIQKLSPASAPRGILRVRHVFVGTLDDLHPVVPSLNVIAAAHISDEFEATSFSSDPGTAGQKEALKTLSQCFPVLRVCSLRNASNASLDDKSIRSSIIGSVLFGIIVPAQEGSHQGISTIGFSGAYGVVGDSCRRLASEFGQRISQRHLQPLTDEEKNGGLPSAFAEFVGRFEATRLAIDLFNQSEVTKATRKDNPWGIAKWKGDLLEVVLDHGLIGLNLTPPHKELQWIDNIRKFSRTFDMTVAYQWRIQIENAALEMSKDLCALLPKMLRDRLDMSVRSVAFAEKALREIDDDLQSQRTADNGKVEGIEEALDSLDVALKSRPNPWMLAARMLVWLVPALIAGPSVITLLYDTTRGLIFSLIYVLMGLMSSLSWIFWQVVKSRRRVENARSRAIDAVLGRQEALLSENLLGYLEDLVVAPLRLILLNDCKNLLETRRNSYQELLKELEGANSIELRSSLTFGPLLTKPLEYARAYEKVNISVDDELLKAVNARLFVLDGNAEATSKAKLIEWCVGRVTQAVREGSLSFRELWSIHLMASGSPDEGASVERIWRLSLPLLEPRFAPSPTDTRTYALIARNLVTGKVWEMLKIPQSAINEFDQPQLLCFYQTGISSALTLYARK